MRVGCGAELMVDRADGRWPQPTRAWSSDSAREVFTVPTGVAWVDDSLVSRRPGRKASVFTDSDS